MRHKFLIFSDFTPFRTASKFGFENIVKMSEKFTASKGREIISFGGKIHHVQIAKPSRGRARAPYKSYIAKRPMGGAVRGLQIPVGFVGSNSSVALETIMENSGEDETKISPYDNDGDDEDTSSAADTEVYDQDEMTIVTDASGSGMSDGSKDGILSDISER